MPRRVPALLAFAVFLLGPLVALKALAVPPTPEPGFIRQGQVLKMPCTATNSYEAHLWKSPIVTEVAPSGTFYPAEDHHQDYFKRNMFNPYCQFVVAPKVEKVRKVFKEKLKRD